MSDRPAKVSRVTATHFEHVQARLGERDAKIAQTVNQLRVVTGLQLQRLHFANLAGRSAEVSRGRALRRLVAWRVLLPLDRRVGGSQRGSTHRAYVLDSIGQRLVAGWQLAAQPTARTRRPEAPGERSIRHTLAVAELYVQLVELTRGNHAQLAAFETEPGSWWPNGLGGWLKPDAYAVLETTAIREHWWLEIDLATESLPTIGRKLLAYLDFHERGQIGPVGVTPRILFSVPTESRADGISRLIRRLPYPAGELLHVSTADRTASHLMEVLRE